MNYVNYRYGYPRLANINLVDAMSLTAENHKMIILGKYQSTGFLGGLLDETIIKMEHRKNRIPVPFKAREILSKLDPNNYKLC